MKKVQVRPTQLFAGILSSALILSVSSCGWLTGDEGYFRDRKHDYRDAQVEKPLQLPEGADADAIRELYPVPGWDGTPQFDSDFSVPMPEVFVTKTQGEIRAFKSAERYWIVVNSPPAESWARVRRFWQLNNIQLEKESPFEGLMQTVWLTREKDGVATRDKFRIRVEHGMHKNSAEVYIMHLGFPKQDELPRPEQVDWSKVKEGDELSEAIMQELASFLIETEYEGAPASLLAQSFSGAPKSSLSTDEQGNRVLLLTLDYERAWESVGKALEDSELEVTDKDRSSGVYYVNYFPDAKEGKKGGWLSFVPFVGGSSPSKGKGHRYRVTLKTEAEQIVVAVASDAEQDDRDLSEAVLAGIRDNLI